MFKINLNDLKTVIAKLIYYTLKKKEEITGYSLVI